MRCVRTSLPSSTRLKKLKLATQAAGRPSRSTASGERGGRLGSERTSTTASPPSRLSSGCARASPLWAHIPPLSGRDTFLANHLIRQMKCRGHNVKSLHFVMVCLVITHTSPSFTTHPHAPSVPSTLPPCTKALSCGI